jgi:SAM-dependent methyltransferase
MATLINEHNNMNSNASMPFAEYRGGGKTVKSFGSMTSRWDAEWIGSEDVSSSLVSNENWLSIQRAIQKGGRVLEAGCGIAKWVAFLSKAGYEAHGLDYSKVAIERSLSLWPELRLARGDLRAMSYEDNFFDAVVSFGAVEHDINGPDAALAEMHRVLRPGGILYCTVPCMNWIRRAGYLHLQNWVVRNSLIRRLTGRQPDVEFFEYVFTPREYLRHLKKAGFSIKELIPLSPYCIETKGPVRRRLIQALHRRLPWCQAHMMAAICLKVPTESSDAYAKA